MMDMMVREVRAVTKGDLKIIRFGSCGSISEELQVGSIAIADSACFIGNTLNNYSISDIVEPCQDLTLDLFNEIKLQIKDNVVKGLNASCDSFYSSQGRLDPNFKDENDGVLKELKEKYPRAITLEMETFQLFSLSHIAHERIDVAACTMVFASRLNGDFISSEKVEYFVKEVGKVILDVLVK